MSKIKAFGMLFLSAVCGGCVISRGPPNDSGFAKTATAKAFEGCYQNAGDGGKDLASHYHFLSDAIWPRAKLDHTTIQAVRVVSVGDDSMKITAESSGHVLHESVFTEGRDYSRESGRIKITSRVEGSMASEPGNVFIGVGGSATYLGIDETGDGKLQESSTLIGTVFLVFPVAAHMSQSVRFKKAPALCNPR